MIDRTLSERAKDWLCGRLGTYEVQEDGYTEIGQLLCDKNTLLEIVMLETNVCPFGYGKGGIRTCCSLGLPGCECADWASAYRERMEGKPEGRP